MALSITYWANYVAGMTKLMRKSEQSVKANHVLTWKLDEDTISSNVQASQRNRTYKVQAVLDDSYGVLYTSCECAMKMFKCHHVAAVLLHGFKDATQTDVKNSWLARPKTAIPRELLTIAEMYKRPQSDYSALGRPVNDSDRQFLYERLSALGRFTGFHWILSPEPPADEQLYVTPVEDLLSSEEYVNSISPIITLRKAMIVSQDTIEKTAKQTIGQSKNPLWAVVRKLRFTASNFGDILPSARKLHLTDALKLRLTTHSDLGSIAAIAWGNNHEDIAVAAYCKLGAQVEPTGVWLHETGALGASPDGLILKAPDTPVHLQTIEAAFLQPDLLEVKCPMSAMDMTVDQAVDQVKDFYIVKVNNVLKLKQTHKYYHQVQGQLYVSNRNCCDFVVWTPKDLQVIRIAKDIQWQPNVNILVQFYFSKFITSFA